MAKKGGSKVSIIRESNTKISSDQKMTSESNKQKIAKIYDIFPAATKDQIAKILQYYDDDENKAMDALTRDGGSEALSNWAESGSLKSKNNKNKKKKKKGRKDTDFGSSATASFDADDSSSLHSSGNVDAEVEKECSVAENRNGILPGSVEETKATSHERLNTPDIDALSSLAKDLTISKPDSNENVDTCIPEDMKYASAEAENPTCVSPVSDSSEKHGESNYRKDRYRSVKDEGHGKHSSRQRTNSFRRSKTTSLSEDSSSIHNAPNAANPTKRGYEKCKKDLNRQTISLQRIHSQVDKGLEESSKKIRNAFNEIRKLLDKRQEQIEQELAKTKEDALNLLKSRQDLAVELKRRVDKTSLTETEWSELRSDVKQFVTERKYDDELGKTIWFQWSMDSITEIVNTFGEVHPVKNVYSQRSHSALGSVAASQNVAEPSPSSSLVNEEIDSVGDKNDVANILDTVEDETLVTKKEVHPPMTRNQPTESRSRVFSNTKFQNQRNKGGFRGGSRGYGGGYSRPNNRNMGYRNNYNYYNDYSNEYRNHSHQERIHDSSAYSNDRNVNNHRNNRGDRRGQNMNYRNSGRFRGNMNQRQSHDTVAKTEPVSNDMSSATSDNPNVVNGYVNNG